MTNTPPEIAQWLQEQFTKIEGLGNELLDPQLYTDADNIPTAIAGTGTVSIAGFYLAAELAARSDEQVTGLAEILARHQNHIEGFIGPEAWPNVLLATVLYLTVQHLEPALALLDDTSTPMRVVEQDYLKAIRAAAATDS
ncbi:hypothetical protein EDF64_11131 [Curtobacterium flaccumfaciens]|uniref:Uncharacterized protein n=1 Tax=Curtobacterium flaccumfaciens TaxID=2035 RepID=A0A4R6DDA6_9MICO|nr:hypothetical protein [Curtobacterium flaccumfaciens]TDN42556.1 hypothetical protein EDF64_11131 [Curtobacterium flaccumfaciens]